jgi:putative CRISPR-associated protein (TIGR02619 family)
MKLLLLSTCGTSLLTNGTSNDQRSWLNRISNLRELDADDTKRIDEHVFERKRLLSNASALERRRMSAELNGIGAVIDRWHPKELKHILVYTDTAVGETAAKLVKDVLEGNGDEVQMLTAGGLRTDDIASFREALAEITASIEEWIPAMEKAGWTPVFNLTGGFKSINSYLQALGMLHAESSVFLFESSSALMEIPRLPIQLAEAAEVRDHLDGFRRMALGYDVSASELAGAPESLLLSIDDNVTTSVWGDIVWQRVRSTLLAERLLEPLSPKMVIDKKVQRAFDGLEKARKILVNEALDALSAHLDFDKPMLKSKTFKTIQGNKLPPSTHELYAWSDGDARRLFGHYENGRFIVDSLSGHL